MRNESVIAKALSEIIERDGSVQVLVSQGDSVFYPTTVDKFLVLANGSVCPILHTRAALQEVHVRPGSDAFYVGSESCAPVFHVGKDQCLEAAVIAYNTRLIASTLWEIYVHKVVTKVISKEDTTPLTDDQMLFAVAGAANDVNFCGHVRLGLIPR